MQHFAGHRRREIGQLVLLYPCPFTVGSLQTDGRRHPFGQIEIAKNLHFLAAHDVVPFAIQADTRDDPSILNRLQSHDRRGEIVRAGRAESVRGFNPSLPATDHSGHSYRRARAVRTTPIRNEGFQRALEPGNPNREFAEVVFQALFDISFIVEQVAAAIGYPPIDGDEFRGRSGHERWEPK